MNQDVAAAVRSDETGRPGPGSLGRTGVRYVVVGAFNTVFGFAVFAGLEVTVGRWWHYLVVLLLTNVIAVLVAFVLYRRFVFRVDGHFLPDLLRFASVYAGSFAVNLAALPLAVDGAGLPVIAAQGIVLAVSAVGTFLLHRRWTFRRPGEAS